MKVLYKIFSLLLLVAVHGFSMDYRVEKQKAWTNWNESQTCLIDSVFFPKTEEEILNIVKQANLLDKKIKVLGAGHSLGPILLPDENQWAISMEEYANLLEIDETNQTVTVQAGITLKKINEVLHEHGLAFENLSAISDQTVGGAIQTGTHGTGAMHGAFHTQIVCMTIINGKGELKTVTPSKNPELFYAYQCGIGAMGIVNTVTFRVIPSRFLREKVQIVKCSDIFAQLEDYIYENEHFRFQWYPYTDCYGICMMNSVERSIERKLLEKNPLPFAQLIKETNQGKNEVSSILDILELGSANPDILAKFNRAFFETNYCRESEFVDRSDYILNHDFFDIFEPSSKVVAYAMESSISSCFVKTFLLELQKLIEESHFPAHGPVEVRFVKADKAYLSPTYSEDPNELFSFISIISLIPKSHPESYKIFFEKFQQLSEKYNGRLHWGKMGQFYSAYLKQVYPKWKEFKKIQEEEDPSGIFLNHFTKKILEKD